MHLKQKLLLTLYFDRRSQERKHLVLRGQCMQHEPQDRHFAPLTRNLENQTRYNQAHRIQHLEVCYLRNLQLSCRFQLHVILLQGTCPQDGFLRAQQHL